jgi:hypothetical protein
MQPAPARRGRRAGTAALGGSARRRSSPPRRPAPQRHPRRTGGCRAPRQPPARGRPPASRLRCRCRRRARRGRPRGRQAGRAPRSPRQRPAPYPLGRSWPVRPGSGSPLHRLPRPPAPRPRPASRVRHPAIRFGCSPCIGPGRRWWFPPSFLLLLRGACRDDRLALGCAGHRLARDRLGYGLGAHHSPWSWVRCCGRTSSGMDARRPPSLVCFARSERVHDLRKRLAGRGD